MRTLLALFERHDLEVARRAHRTRRSTSQRDDPARNADDSPTLDYQPQEETFRSVDEPLEADVVLIDETSMVDLHSL